MKASTFGPSVLLSLGWLLFTVTPVAGIFNRQSLLLHDALSLTQCPETRAALIQSNDGNNYFMLLEAMRTDLDLLRSAAIIGDVTQITSLTGFIPPVVQSEDNPVGAGSQLILEGLAGQGLGLNFFSIVRDVLTLVCDGFQRTDIVPVPASTWQKFKTFLVSLPLIGDGLERTFVSDANGLGPRLVVRRQNSSAPQKVWRVLRGFFRTLEAAADRLRFIPLQPIALAARVLDRVFGGLGDLLGDLITSTGAKCNTADGKVKRILFVLEVLRYSRLALSVYSVLVPEILRSRFSMYNDEYELLLGQDNIPSCPLTETIAPTTGDGFGLRLSFLNDQLDAIDLMIQEWNDANSRRMRGRARALQVLDTDAYLAQFEPIREVSGFVNDMATATVSVNSALDNLVDTFIENIGSDALQALLVELPNRLEAVLDTMQSISSGLQGPIDIVQAILDNVPSPPSPFGEVISLFQSAICGAVDFISQRLFGIEICEAIEGFFEDLFSDLLGDFQVPSFDELLGELNILDDIAEIFAFDLNGFLDLPNYLGDLSYLAPRFTLDLENPLAGLNGLFEGISLTPANIMVQNLAQPSALTDGVSRHSFLAVDSTVIQYRCPGGWTPITTAATYRTIGRRDDGCTQSLTGQLRYPCNSVDDNECEVDIQGLLSCQTALNPVLYDDLGMFRSELIVRYFCFDDLNDFKIPVALTNGTTTATVFELDTTQWTTNPRLFGDSIFEAGGPNDGVIETNLILYYSDGDEGKKGDSFRRVGYGGVSTEMAPLDCSVGFADRRIHIEKMDFYFDPCLASFDTIQYSRDNRTVDLCGYKLLYDHNALNGCSRIQTYSEAKRTESFSLLNFREQPEPSRGLQPICWAPNPETGRATNITWEYLALNLENCEFFYNFEENRPRSLCPFYNALYYGRTNKCPLFVPCFGFETFYDGFEACASPDSNGDYGPPYPPFRDEGDESALLGNVLNGFGNIKNFANCDQRRAAELVVNQRFQDHFEAGFDQLLTMFPRAFNTGYNPNVPNILAFQQWSDNFAQQKERCTEQVQQCIQNESRCDLKAMDCIPPGALWACVEDPDNPRTTRTHMWGESHTRGVQIDDKTVTCPFVTATVEGQAVNVDLELYIESALETDPMNFLTWQDLSEEMKSYCNVAEGVSSCSFVQGTEGFPADDFVREVETQCKCPPGYERELVDGTCEPCTAGSTRNRLQDVCEACPVGTYAGPASSECSLCPVGTFGPNPESTSIDSCYPCRRGTFAPAEASFECENCPAGSYQPSEGQSFCLPVDASFYQPDEGETIQLPCPPGSFSDDDATECTLCPPGTFASSGAATQCSDCPAGFYSVVEGSSSCEPCNYGYYSESPAADSCQPCAEGLTTRERGASSVSLCVVPFDPLELEQIFVDGSDPQYNTGIMVTLPDFSNTGMETRNIQEVDEGCLALLAKYTNPDVPETDKLLEIGNGYCNGGPWNTPPCGFDGGDCCISTCNLGVLIDDTTDPEVAARQIDGSISSGHCSWLDMQCRDTDPMGNGESLQCTESRRRFRQRRQRMLQFIADGHAGDKSNDEFINGTATRRELLFRAESNARVGDGRCNPEFNNAENSYDLGDCCASTCSFNGLFTESCRPQTLENCIDPDVLMAEKFEDVDSAPPMIKVVEDFTVECGQIPVYLQNSAEESPFDVMVTDNNPCFEGTAAVSYSREIIPRASTAPCDGQKFLFQYSAQDASENTGTKTVTVSEKDTLAPVLACVDQTLSVEPKQAGIQLPPLVAEDACDGEIAAVYTTAVEGISIDNNGVMTNWQGDSSVLVTATATDICGHTQQCNIMFEIATQAPSDVPSAIPSTLPSAVPSEVPSMAPSETLVLPLIEMVPKQISATAFFEGAKLQINVLTSDELNVVQIDLESLLVGKLGTETKPKVLTREIDIVRPGKKDLKLLVESSELGFDATESSTGTIEIILTGGMVDGGGRIKGTVTLELLNT